MAVNAETRRRFVMWQWFIGGFHIATALAITLIVFAFENDWKVNVHTSFNIWQRSKANSECSPETPCAVGEYRTPTETRLSLGGVVSSFSYFSGAHHLFLAYSSAAVDTIENTGVNVWRWWDYAWSASLMLALNSVLFLSPPDAQTITLWFAASGSPFSAATAPRPPGRLVWPEAERTQWPSTAGQQRPTLLSGTSWASFIISTTDVSGAVRVGGGYFANASEAEPLQKNDPPILVWVILTWLCGSFLLFPIVHALKISRNPQETDALRYEVYYSFLSLFSKIPLAAVFASGVINRDASTTLAEIPAKLHTQRGNNAANRHTGFSGRCSICIGHHGLCKCGTTC